MTLVRAASDSRADTSDLIRFEHVRLVLGGLTIFEDLNFAIPKGEFVCLLGPSGCGKSTTLRLMGDLLPYDGGRVIVEGGTPAQNWQKLAYVFQSPRLAPWRDALANVRLGMELRRLKLPRAEMDARARAMLDLVGLGADAAKYPRMLSGGEKQRVAIARALSVDPDVIMMDEPFSALDPNTRQRLRGEIVSIWRKTGKTIVFVTHDVDEALLLADRIILFSPKPTIVLETIILDQSRPRGDGDWLRQKRGALNAAFARMEENREK